MQVYPRRSGAVIEFEYDLLVFPVVHLHHHPRTSLRIEHGAPSTDIENHSAGGSPLTAAFCRSTAHFPLIFSAIRSPDQSSCQFYIAAKMRVCQSPFCLLSSTSPSPNYHNPIDPNPSTAPPPTQPNQPPKISQPKLTPISEPKRSSTPNPPSSPTSKSSPT